MLLDPGARLGPYEIVASIGAGGMGAVYKATDTRLGRDVACVLSLSGAVIDQRNAASGLPGRFKQGLLSPQ